MYETIRRLLLIIATSSGVLAATAFTADAGRVVNHSETRLSD